MASRPCTSRHGSPYTLASLGGFRSPLHPRGTECGLASHRILRDAVPAPCLTTVPVFWAFRSAHLMCIQCARKRTPVYQSAEQSQHSGCVSVCTFNVQSPSQQLCCWKHSQCVSDCTVTVRLLCNGLHARITSAAHLHSRRCACGLHLRWLPVMQRNTKAKGTKIWTIKA